MPRAGIVIGMDPGLATFGLVAVLTTGTEHKLLGHHTFESSKSDTGVTIDMVRRAGELREFLDSKIRRYAARMDGDIVGIAAEAISYPRGSRPIALISIAWGVISSVLAEHRMTARLVAGQPSAVRVAVAGGPRRAATSTKPQETKEEFRWRARTCAIARVEDARLMPQTGKRSAHAMDALVCAVWSLDTPTVKAGLFR